MRERIQKILSARGLTSRRNAETMIEAGRVSCNGIVCRLGDTADPQHDTILVDGVPIPAEVNKVYIMLHKPKGYVTTLSDEKGRPDAAQLVANCGVRVFPVGRLDMDSEGLLIFTNDGNFANRLMHPKHEINKTYLVTVKNYSDEALERLKRPVVMEGYRIRMPEVTCLHKPDTSDGYAQVRVTIHEGRNRQVRRMCAYAGMRVIRLVRISEGPLSLGDLPSGKWRFLTDAEVSSL